MKLSRTFAPVVILAALAATPSPGFGAGNAAMGLPFDFAAVDADTDGNLTAAEMTAFHDARMQAIDADKDGFVSAGEMQAALLARMSDRAAGMAGMRIGRQDTDKDGRLSQTELVAGPRAERLFARIDANGDGAISRAELEAARARMVENRKRHGGAKHRMSGFWGDDSDHGAKTD